MSLSFLHGGIALLGVAAAAIPVIIHLLLRQKPKPIIFPALELIRSRHTHTVKKLRLRNLLLLMMRVGLLLLLGLALARPTLHSSLFSIDQEAPVSAILVFDTSLSMDYKHRGQTQLEHARELAQGVLERLPENSEVSVVESSAPAIGVMAGVPEGAARTKNLQPSPVFRPINEAVAAAINTLEKSSHERHEIYIFTDLAANSWNYGDGERLKALADKLPGGLRIYLVTLGVERPANIALNGLDVSGQILPVGSELKVSISLHNSGAVGDYRVELTLDGEARDVKPVRVPAGESQEVVLSAAGLTEGLHQGQVSVGSGDPLTFDDTRYFTVEARPPMKVLVASDRPSDAQHFVYALRADDPTALQQGARRFNLDVVTTDVFSQTDLQPYKVVCLLNVGTLRQEAWVKLSDFIQAGGGLFVALGDRVDHASYNTPAAQNALPAKLEKETKAADQMVLAPERFNHPLLAKFREWESNDMAILPILRYWKVAPAEGGALTVIPYSQGDPALLERSFGQGKRGKGLMLTTAAHYAPTAPWNELPLGWSYIVLVEQIVRYLGGMAETRLNFDAGDNAVVELPASNQQGLYVVTGPDAQIQRLNVVPGETSLTVPMVRVLGHYRVEGAERGPAGPRGFSVNEPESESILTPLDAERIKESLGAERVSIAADPEKVETVVDESRVGREIFPWLMFLILLLICLEGYFANRFYKR